MKPETINILIIDDHEVIVEGVNIRLKRIFNDVHSFFASNARNAISLISKHHIDLVICDLSFRNGSTSDGFEIIQKIKALKPDTKSIAYTSFDSYRIMKKALNSGFDSFLDKGCSFQDFSETVLGVLKKGGFESATIKRLKKNRYEYIKSVFNTSFQGIFSLSPKEIELILYCTETTDRNALAEKMHIKPTTVDTHFNHISDKLKLSNRKEVALFGMEFKDELIHLTKS